MRRDDGEPISGGQRDRRAADRRALGNAIWFVAFFAGVVLVNGILAILGIEALQGLGVWLAYAGTRGLRVGRLRLRWIDECAPMPDRVVRVSGMAEPVLIRAELAPVMVQERAELKVWGLRLPRPFHRLTITVADGGPWLAFVEARATPFGLRRH